MKKKIMILGASVGQLALIRRAKELGYHVAVVDYDDHAIGIPEADIFYHASTIDKEAVVQAALDYKPDGITTVQTDMPMCSIAAAAYALGLPGISEAAALNATNKEKMIEAFKKNSVSSPYYIAVNSDNGIMDAGEAVVYPCIVKPVDNSGSRGVSFVKNKSELKDALKYACASSRNGRLIIEEYMRGPEVSVEVLMISGTAHILAITDKLTTGVPHFVELGHSQQSQLDNATKKQIKKLAEAALIAVGVSSGPAHVEIIVTASGPKMVELGARLGGDFITTDLVPLSTGIDMLEAALKLSCGEEPDVSPSIDKGSAIRFITASEGKIVDIKGIEYARRMPGIKKIELLRNVGDYVPGLRSSLDRVGYVVAQASDAKAAIKCCEAALDKIIITTCNRIDIVKE